MSLYAELKKRNVVRTAVTYLVIAWLMIQIGNVLFNTLELDSSANKLLFAILVLGFLPALLFSWAYEITPEGIKHEKDLERNESYTNLTAKKLDILTIILVILAMIMFALDRFTQVELLHKPNENHQLIESNSDDDLAKPQTKELAIAGQIIDDRPSIAVLPFINMSANKENEYFSDGISEDILNALVRIDGLQVASRTSSFSFKDNMPDIPTVAKALKVNHIVEGSVRRAGDQVRITAQLIEVSSDKHLWSETYTRELKDVFAIQDEISAAIATALQLTLKSKSAARFTDSIEAYDLYLQGLAKLRELNALEKFDESIALFDRSLKIDNNFAEAHAGRCDAYRKKYLEFNNSNLIDLAILACEKAIELDPEAPQVLVSQGLLYLDRGQGLEALKLFNQVIELQPNYSEGYSGRAQALDTLGKLPEALESYKRAISLQPDVSDNYHGLGRTLFLNGRFEEAAVQFMSAIKLSPDRANTYSSLGGTYFFLGEFGKAAEAFKQSIAISPNANAYSNAGTNYYYQGEFEAAFSMFTQAVELSPAEFIYSGNLADTCQMLISCQQKAKQYYQTALNQVNDKLRVNPTDTLMLVQKAMYLSRLGEQKLAKKILSEALSTDSENPDFYYTAALIAVADNNPTKVKEYANQALLYGYPEKALKADPYLEKYFVPQ